MTERQLFSRGVLLGVLLTTMLAVGAFTIDDSFDTIAHIENDRRADELTAKLLSSERRGRKIEQMQLAASKVADSASRVAARLQAERRAPNWQVATGTVSTTPSTSASGSGQGDTTAYIGIIRRDTTGRAVDVAPILVPQFVLDELAATVKLLQATSFAWQRERDARLLNDTLTVPDLRRQLNESGDVIRAERVRIEDRDRTIEQQGRELARRRRFGFKQGVAAGGGLALLLIAAIR